VPLYDTIVARYREPLAALLPHSAYGGLFDVAYHLARTGFREFGGVTTSFPARDAAAVAALARAYEAYRRRDLPAAMLAAEAVLSGPFQRADPLSAHDADYVRGRIQIDEERVAEAGETFQRLMADAERLGYVAGFVRALHEISRVNERRHALFEAEAGFRVALDFYGISASDPGAADESSLASMRAALNCLSNLADDYFLMSRGPTDAVSLIDWLGSTEVRSADDSGYDFLEIRGLVLNLLVRQDHVQHMSSLIGKAMKLHAGQRALSLYALEEAAWAGGRKELRYPSVVRDILSQSDPFPLRSAASFKPDRAPAEVRPASPRYTAVTDPADSIETLRIYLAAEDETGRFVYRGQTKEYDAPLLPSAFRGILRAPHPVETVDRSSIESEKRLRRCGERFVGEYNRCFLSYADVMKPARDAGVGQAEVERIFHVYKRLLDDLSLTFAQTDERFVPWQTAVRQVLSAEEREIYMKNAVEWEVRIDNYHRRLLRDEAFVQLFGYALGTTFAQQYGLSSEGLDATKSLDVAAFFATHDSSDFMTVPDDGVGVVYRFPFPVNDVASRPLADLTYYNLPPIVDVEDVFYRFEHERMHQEDSIGCMASYLMAAITYGLQSPDMVLLPKGFLEASRVHAQGAVILIPDEIREDEPGRRPSPSGIVFPKYRYIEDLRSRPGVAHFYFRHTGRRPEKPSITRERLWPRDDFLLETLVILMAASYPLRMRVPKRLDLIDGGYDRAGFLAHCISLYEREHYRMRFLDGRAGVALSKFHTLTL